MILLEDFVFKFHLNILALNSGDDGCSGAKTAIESLKVSKPFFKFISVSFYYLPPSVENEFETQIFTSLLIDIFSEEMSQESVYQKEDNPNIPNTQNKFGIFNT